MGSQLESSWLDGNDVPDDIQLAEPLEFSSGKEKDVDGGMEQLGHLIRRNLAPIQSRVHRGLIEAELQAVRTDNSSSQTAIRS